MPLLAASVTAVAAVIWLWLHCCLCPAVAALLIADWQAQTTQHAAKVEKQSNLWSRPRELMTDLRSTDESMSSNMMEQNLNAREQHQLNGFLSPSLNSLTR